MRRHWAFVVAGATACFPSYAFIAPADAGAAADAAPDATAAAFCATADAGLCEDFEEGTVDPKWRVRNDCAGGAAAPSSGAFRASVPSLPSGTGCGEYLRATYAEPWRRARIAFDVRATPKDGGTSGPSLANISFGPPPIPCAAEIFLIGGGSKVQLILQAETRENEEIPLESGRSYRFDVEVEPGTPGRMTIGHQKEGEPRNVMTRSATCAPPASGPTMIFTVGLTRYSDAYVSPAVDAQYDNILLTFP